LLLSSNNDRPKDVETKKILIPFFF